MNQMLIVPGTMLIVMIAAASITRTYAQSKSPLDGFAEFADSVRVEWRAPGLAVAIVKDGKVIFSEGFGLRDVANGLPVTTRTVFPIGSATKPFTAMAVAMLVDDKKLDLDKSLIDQVPDFRLHEDYATLNATARDLLCHRTGLPGLFDLLWFTTPVSREELFRRLRYLKPSSGFRDRFQYSNLSYTAAGVVVERISGIRWEDFVTKRIFRPLGMKRTGFTVPATPSSEDSALPYRVVQGEAKPIPFKGSIAFDNVAMIGPAASIASSVEDMARWVLLHLNGGTHGGERLISEKMLAEMHSPQMAIRDPGFRTLAQAETYGLSWTVSNYRGRRVVNHGGNIEGFSSFVSTMPEINSGVVVLSNTMNLLGYVLARNVHDRLLGLDTQEWNDYFRTLYSQVEQAYASAAATPVSDAAALPALPLKSYVGTYVNPAFGSVRVTTAEGGLATEFESGLQAELHHLRFNRFKGPTAEFYLPAIEVRFHLGDEGTINSLSIFFCPGTNGVLFERDPTTITKSEYGSCAP